MISKGLDLPGVTLVGSLMSDSETGLVDFRAAEKTFAKLTQVAGRSGRSKQRGLALAQTFNPESELMRSIQRGEYQEFFDREIRNRETLAYPPFSHLLRIILQDVNEDKLGASAAEFLKRLLAEIPSAQITYRTLGPAPCQLYRLRGRYRRHVLLFTKTPLQLSTALSNWEARENRFKLPASTKVTVDVDPYDLM